MKAITARVFALFLSLAAVAQPSHDTLWTRTYGGREPDAAASFQRTADGGFILAGYTWSFGAGYTDFYLVKTGPEQNWIVNRSLCAC
ncbi:hypothetical protein KKH27_07775 [bacterium]|nr:hypothetical protein [bacterium]MBU1984277.1 hypothetical protein [bacterium]